MTSQQNDHEVLNSDCTSKTETQKQKEVEFYAASINAWFNTALEHDKSIFTLSAGGIGLLATLMTGVDNSRLLYLYIAAMCAFSVSLCMILVIFRRNRTHIEQVLAGKETLDGILSLMDIGGKIAFGIGMILTAAIGISAAITSYETKIRDSTMANEKKTSSSNPTFAQDSVNGLGGLQKSFNNLASIQPKPTSPTPPAKPLASQQTPSTKPVGK
ncbi:hypothetical protein D3C81_801510 [compost metagenome]